MKNLKFIITSLLLVVFLSCDKDDAAMNRIYDNVNGQTLISFASNASDLPVVIDNDGSVEITIESSTVSTSDRTVNISIDPNSTANAENYMLSTNVVTIPANAYSGTFTIDAEDISVEPASESIIVNIDSAPEGSIVGRSTHTVSIFQVCPIPDDFFVGSYLIEQITPQIDGYSLSHNSVVEVYSTGDTQRSFQTEAYISYCSGTFFEFNINLVCNEFVVPLNSTTCACSNFDDWWGPAITNSPYNLADDSVLEVTFTDDVQGDCGTPAQTTYRFTKQ